MLINAGKFDELIGTRVDPASAALIKNQLINTPPILFLVSGLERFCAILIQIALSLVVLYGVMNRKGRYVLYAILLHTLVNAPPSLMPRLGLNIWWVEFSLVFWAVIALVWIFRSRALFLPLSTEKGIPLNEE